ncbi:MAG: hypothetical protein QNJ64_02610 [Crocosphaera sp.]|nr:hypothetical protein [Crocosphaera sp.]
MSQSSNSLKTSQKRTLDAWEITLKRVNIEQFPEDLKIKIEQIERELSQNNYQVINEINNIVQENTDLSNAYQIAREELAKDYNSQEKNKIAIPWDSSYSTDETSYYQTKNPKALFILQELDASPLTVRDLKYRLNLPPGDVLELLKKLWNQRKINKVSGNIWYSIFPITKPKRFDIKEDDSKTYFTLTSLGEMELRKSIRER